MHMPVQKRRQKGSRVSYLVLLLVVFKWHHGSEGVKHHGYLLCVGRIDPNISAWHLKTLSPTPLRVVQRIKRRSSNQSWNYQTSSKLSATKSNTAQYNDAVNLQYSNVDPAQNIVSTVLQTFISTILTRWRSSWKVAWITNEISS